MRRLLVLCLLVPAGLGVGAAACSSFALASPGWTAPGNFPLPAKEPGSLGQTGYQIGYQAGGTATIVYLEVLSLGPLQTVLHAGVIPPGGAYQEQLRIASTAGSIPAEAKLAEAPSGAAVLEWVVLQGSDAKTSPLAYMMSYRPAGSSTWEAPVTVAEDSTRVENINGTVVPAISADGTAAAGVDHLDPALSPAGYEIDVAVHPSRGTWEAPTPLSPAAGPGYQSSEDLALGFDATGDLTAAYRMRLPNERYTLAAKRRPASSGVWGSLEDVTGSGSTSDAERPVLGVAPDGSAVIAFQYVHYAPSETLDVNAVTRYGATGTWTAPVDVALGGVSSGPLAAGVSPEDKANVLYRFQGHSSAEDCIGVVRASAGGDFFSAPQCVSPTNFEPGAAGGVAFVGNDAYFAWSGEPNGEKVDVVQGSRWLGSASQPDSFSNLDAPIESAELDQLLPDEDGSVAAFWTTRVETAPSQYETKLRAAAFDAGGPNLLGAAVPAGAVAGRPVAMSASFADLWSGLGEPPSWSFGDGASAGGAQVSHTYAVPGVYTVTVTAHDGLGNATSSTYSITVTPAPFSPPPAPVLKLIGSKVVGQRVVLSLACTGAPCTGEAKLATSEKLISGKLVAVQSRHRKLRTTYKKVTVGVSHFTLAPGQTLTVAVALNATGRGLLARFRKLPVSLTIAARPAIPARHLTILSPKRSTKHRKH